MFYQLSEFQDVFSPFRIFQYITVRTFLAAGTAFVLSLVFGERIRGLKRLKLSQQFRDDKILADHLKKAGTPTMGGIMIISMTLVSSLLWAIPNVYVLLTLGTLLFLGGVGFLDDFLKIRRKNSDGLSGKWKIVLQGFLALLLLVIMWNHPETKDSVQQLFVPFLKDPIIPTMGIGTLIFIRSL